MSESSKTGAPADSYVFSITQYVFGVNHFMQVFLDFYSRFFLCSWSHCNISTIIPPKGPPGPAWVGAAVSGAFVSACVGACGRCRTRCLCFCRCWRLRLCRSCCFCWRRGLYRLRLRRFCRTARRTLLRTRQIVADHRVPAEILSKDRFCNTRRQVDTAVGTARLVNRTAKTASPLHHAYRYHY